MICLLISNSKEYNDLSFNELTMYLLLSTLDISDIAMEGTNDIKGSINP